MSNLYFDSNSNAFELPGARPHYIPDRPGQVDHIFLDLVLNIPKQRFSGTCQIQLTPIRAGITQLQLDAMQLNIKGVEVNNQPQVFHADGETLTIELSDPTSPETPLVLKIDYSVKRPRRGLYFVAPT
ncbi:MAG: aminopeptidase, partial [Phormidium sp. GEM2.Bin31]